MHAPEVFVPDCLVKICNYKIVYNFGDQNVTKKKCMRTSRAACKCTVKVESFAATKRRNSLVSLLRPDIIALLVLST